MSAHQNIIAIVEQHAAAPAVGVGLLAAGLIPNLFTTTNLQFLYFCLIIPPTAYHFYAWLKTTFWDHYRERCKNKNK